MRSWIEELKKEIKKDVYERRPSSPIDHCVFEEDSQKPLQSFIEIANKHKDKKTLKQQREEIFLEIVIKEKELLEKYADIKIKYYDWETGQHVNPNSIILFTSIIKERIRELDRVILEGMTTKDFKHLYGGIDSTGILSISPNLVSSTFAQDVVTKGVEATTHQFGSEFPGAFIHSIGDFNPQSLSKADINMMAVPTPTGDAISWDPFSSTLPNNYQLGYSTPTPDVPGGWGQNSDDPGDVNWLDNTATQMVSRGETTDTHTDIYYTPNISQDSAGTITLKTGTNTDYQNLDPNDLLTITGLWSVSNATKPMNRFQGYAYDPPADADDQINDTKIPPLPITYDADPLTDYDNSDPIYVTPLLRTFNNKSAGDKITFDWTFNAPTDYLSNPTNSDEVPGDGDDAAFVYINGDNTFYRLVNVYDHDTFRIGDDAYYDDDRDGDSRQEDNAGRKTIRPEFRSGGSGKISGKFEYTVKSGDIDSNGNFKFWVFISNTNPSYTEGPSLDIVGLTGTGTGTDPSRTAAGQLGKTTDAYDLGYKVHTKSDLLKLLRGDQLEKFRVKKTTKQKLKDKYDYEYTENDGWMDDFKKGGKTADAISNLLTIGLSLIAAKALIATIGPAAAATVTRGAKVLDGFSKWWNKGKNVRVKNEDTADLKTLWQDEMQQLTRSDAAFQAGKTGLDGWNPFKAFSPKMVKTGPSPAVRQAGRIFRPGITPGATAGGEMQRESYDFLSEQVDTDDKFIKQMAKTLDKIKKPAELEKMVEFMKAASKAKEKFEQKKNAAAGNSKSLYPGQPSPNGFPDTPPPQLAPNGYHPEFGKKSDRYRRLDPVSAVAMNRVKTGDSKTDAQVAAAAKKSKLKSVKEFKKEA